MGNTCCNERGNDEAGTTRIDPQKDDTKLIPARTEVKSSISLAEIATSAESDLFPKEINSHLCLGSNPGVLKVIEKYGLYNFPSSPVDSLKSIPFYKQEDVTPDGRKYRYFGQMENGVKHGRGHLHFLEKDGEFIIGTFVNGKAEGEGAVYFSNGDYFKGKLSNNQMSSGVILLQNGTKYEGPFVNNLYNGHGILNFNDGRKYKGDFKNGKREGKGFYTWLDGSTYDGDWLNGMQHGRGVYVSKSGAKVEADFYEGKKLIKKVN